MSVRAHRVELGLLAALAVASAAVWPAQAPAGFVTPDLPRDSVLILVAGVYAAVLVLTTTPVQPHLEELAAINMVRARGIVAAAVVGYALALAWSSSMLMDDLVAAQFLRNVVIFVGAALAVAPLSRIAALCSSPVWASVSVAAGHQLVPGGPPDVRQWAIPVLPGENAHPAALTALLVGVGAFTVLGTGRNGRVAAALRLRS